MNRKAIQCILCIFFAFGNSGHINAAGSIYGGEVYYQYEKGSIYRIYAVVYASCNGIAPNANGLAITDGTNTITPLITKCCTSYYNEGISSNTCTRCPSNPTCSFPYGFQFITIYGDVDVSYFSGCKLTVFFAGSALPSTITTGGANENFYISTTLNRCNGDHSSPQFQESPAMMLINGSLTDLYQSVMPASKNDSIVYRFINPYSAAGQSIPYTTGYAYNYPLRYLGKSTTDPKPKGFHYDARSGEMYFTPAGTDVTLISIEADEYARNKSGAWYLAGTTARTTVTFCINNGNTSNSPQIAAPAGAKNDTVYTCAGIPLTLQFKTSDQNNSKDTISINNILNETSGSFAYSGGINPTATLYWTPANTDVNAAPYKVIMMATDDGSPLYKFVQSTLYIYVIDSMPDDSIIPSTNGCGQYRFTSKDKRWAGQNYTWYADGKIISQKDTATYTFPFNGRHAVMLKVKNTLGCEWYFYDTLNITILPNVIAGGGKKICQGTGIALYAKGAASYSWYPISGLATDTGASITAYPNETTEYYVSGTDNKGCQAIDSVNIPVDAIQIPFHTDTTLCYGQFIDINGNTPGGASYLWTSAAGSQISDSSGLYLKLLSDTHYVYKVTDSFGCTKTLSGIIRPDHLNTNITNNVSVCFGDSVQLSASGGTVYDWVANLGLPQGSTKPNPFVRPPSNRYYYVTITDKYGCYATDSVNVIVSEIQQYPNQLLEICQGDSVFLQASKGKTYAWAPPYNISSSHSAGSYVHPDTTTTYVATICDTFCGCVVRDTFHLKVDPIPKALPGINQQICQGHSAAIGTKAIPDIGYVWNSRPGGYLSTNAQNVVIPAKTTTYILHVKNLSTGCQSVDSVKISVDTFDTRFFGSVAACKGDTDAYQVTTYKSSNMYSWRISGGHVLFSGTKLLIVKWDSTGTGSVTLTEELPGQCSDSSTVNINTFPIPSGHIAGVKNICSGSGILLRDSGYSGHYKTLWHFGNGDTSNVNNPTYTYPVPGIYHISLISSNAQCGSIDTATIHVFSIPVRTPLVHHTGYRQYLFNNADSTGIKYIWYSGDGDSIAYSRILHTYIDTGLYTVIFKYGYAWGCGQVYDTIIHVSDEMMPPPPQYKDTVSVAPNPFIDQLRVDFSHSEQESIQIIIFDVLGQQLTIKNIDNQAPGSYNFNFKTPQFRRGIYFLKYAAGSDVKTFKIIRM